MDWSPQQAAALIDVQNWLNGPKERKTFRLFGFAGTGKSTLAKRIGEIEKARGGYAQFCAFTGKAAVVMKRKGCENARTLHSIIYTTMDKSRTRLDGLNKLLANTSIEADRDTIIRQIEEERENLKSPGFHLKEDALTVYQYKDDEETREPVATITLFVMDECSMVDERLAEDLLSFGARVLVLGDPAQLPPVKGNGYFTNVQPDVLLTEIHRQALDSPIIKMANTIRRGGNLGLGDYGDGCAVVNRRDLTSQHWIDADQILCGRNDTRKAFNDRMRELRGYKGNFLPLPGEKLVCLRNNHEEGLLNGSLWECIAAEDRPHAPTFWLKLRALDDDREIACLAHKAPFLGEELDPWEIRESNHFDFGYALTVHKAQGSQWDHVVLYDEWNQRQSKQQWQYTGITRASKRLTVVRP